MGSFAALYQERGNGMPGNKKNEFRKRVEHLFQAGGMVEFNNVKLYDKEVVTIQKATMKEYGMDFYYNYFEEAYWENVRVNRKHVRRSLQHMCWKNFIQKGQLYRFMKGILSSIKST